MARLHSTLGSWLVLSVGMTALLTNCGGDDTPPAGMGGFPDAGKMDSGAAGKGGTGVGVGGQVGTGGTSAADGSVDAGGADGGAGGSVSAGGSPGTGGSAALGGSDAGSEAGTGGAEAGVGGNNGVGGTSEAGAGDAAPSDATPSDVISTDAAAEDGALTDAALDAGADTGSGSSLCATGCAVASVALAPDASNTNARFILPFAARNLLGATITARLCFQSATTGHFQVYVQNDGTPGYAQYHGENYAGYKNNLSEYSCSTGMHTISYVIQPPSGNAFDATLTGRVGFEIGTAGGTPPYASPTVMYIDSVTITDLPGDGGTMEPYEFAPIDGGQNLQGFRGDFGDSLASVSWVGP